MSPTRTTELQSIKTQSKHKNGSNVNIFGTSFDAVTFERPSCSIVTVRIVLISVAIGRLKCLDFAANIIGLALAVSGDQTQFLASIVDELSNLSTCRTIFK
jgi:hypothetical protein